MISSPKNIQRSSVARILGAMVALLVAALVLVMPGSASALPNPIDGSAGYPAPLPDGCTVDGASIVDGEMFSLAGVTASSMRSLPNAPGSVLTMTWDSFAPGCEGVGISLSAKSSSAPQFDPNSDQFLLPGFDYCGPLGPTCPESGPYSLSIVVPPLAEASCYQLDAAIGAPLAVVGPGGSFYGLGQSQNMLISALNGGSEPCTATTPATEPPATVAPTTVAPTTVAPTTVPPTTVAPCPTNPALPADSPDCVEVPATVLGSTTIVTTSTTAATSSSTSPTTAATSTSAVSTSTPGASVLGATTIAGALATTGSSSNRTVALGGALLLVGLAIVLLAPRGRKN